MTGLRPTGPTYEIQSSIYTIFRQYAAIEHPCLMFISGHSQMGSGSDIYIFIMRPEKTQAFETEKL